MCHHSYLAATYKSENPAWRLLRLVCLGSPEVWLSQKQGDELTILASCLSGLEDVGFDGAFSSYSLLLEEKQKENCDTLTYSMHVSGACSRPSVCIWMCLRRKPASVFTRINIWHWLHALWSAFHPIWTINVSAIHHGRLTVHQWMACAIHL